MKKVNFECLLNALFFERGFCMKNFFKLTICGALLMCSSSVLANGNIAIPNLFGAYIQGAEAARQQNARYYYYDNSPAISIGVYSQGSNTSKKDFWGDNSKKVSLSKEDALCWIVYNIPANTTYHVEERFYNPEETLFQVKTDGSNVKAHQQLSNNISYFYRQLNSGNSDQISACYIFDEKMAKGSYKLTVKVGKFEFNTQTFKLIK